MNVFLKKPIILAVVFWGVAEICSSTMNRHNSALRLSTNSLEIRAVILDYVEGAYEADTLRIYESVHPDLVKRGTSFNRQKGEYSDFTEMTFDQLVQLTKTWNRDGSRADENSLKEIVIYDVQEKTAAAKVTAIWGTDYFHLAKIGEKWWIMNVLWQSHQLKN